MNAKRLFLCAVTSLLALSLVFTSCGGGTDKEQSKEPSSSQQSTVQSEAESETDISVDTQQALQSGAVAIENGGEYTIDKEISGTVVINTKEALTLKLKNAVIKSENGPALYVLNCKDLVISLEGENVLTDGAVYADPYLGAKGALFTEDDVTFTGSGSLTVNASGGHGIVCDDGIVIEDTSITVNSAAKDAVHANDTIRLNRCNLVVNNAQGDGIHSELYVDISESNVDINTVGDGIKASADATDLTDINVMISNSNVKITSEEDGIQADCAVTIEGGNVDITTTGEVVNDNQGGMFPGGDFGGGMTPPGGDFGGGMTPPGGERPGKGERPSRGDEPQNGDISNMPAPMPVSVSETASTSNETQSDSSKGIKAGKMLGIWPDTLKIDSTDDALHSNGDIQISSGTINIKTGDDAIHADNNVQISGGVITVTSCYEGVEGRSISIDGGNIFITASDDGINASDGSAVSNRPGQANDNCSININGGYVYINSEGDGIDSNGHLYIDGGTVLVAGPNGRGNNALDADGQRYINGGVVIAAGGTDMLELPSSGSTQNSAVIYTGTLSANTTVALADKDGNAVFCYTLAKTASTLIVSMPELEKGKTYTLYKDVTPANKVESFLYKTEADFTGGTVVKTFTQGAVVTQAR